MIHSKELDQFRNEVGNLKELMEHVEAVIISRFGAGIIPATLQYGVDLPRDKKLVYKLIGELRERDFLLVVNDDGIVVY